MSEPQAFLQAAEAQLGPRGLTRDAELIEPWLTDWRGRFHGRAQAMASPANAEELAANPRLDRWFIQDLNRDTTLPLDSGAFDGALCCVGVQYLQRPYDVFAEVQRVLAHGAPCVVSFSNRCFPTKAVAVWRSLNMNGQASLVRHYLEHAGFRDAEVRVLADGAAGDPLIAIAAYA